jgi:predicted DNA-binding protein (MmcQ/YjbR family)
MTPPPLNGFAKELRTLALSLPEATEDFPWGERAFKVRGKTFMFLSVREKLSFSMKLGSSAAQVLVMPFASPTHYGLGRHGWVTFEPPARMSGALRKQFAEWMRDSYAAVAPKALARAIIGDAAKRE